MKVYRDEAGATSLVGRADLPESVGAVYEVRLFGAASSIVEQYTIGTVTVLPPNGGAPVIERVVILAGGQYPGMLPGWQPLAS